MKLIAKIILGIWILVVLVCSVLIMMKYPEIVIGITIIFFIFCAPYWALKQLEK